MLKMVLWLISLRYGITRWSVHKAHVQIVWLGCCKLSFKTPRSKVCQQLQRFETALVMHLHRAAAVVEGVR